MSLDFLECYFQSSRSKIKTFENVSFELASDSKREEETVPREEVIESVSDNENLHHHQELTNNFVCLLGGGVSHFAAHGGKMTYTTPKKLTYTESCVISWLRCIFSLSRSV